MEFHERGELSLFQNAQSDGVVGGWWFVSWINFFLCVVERWVRVDVEE